MPFVIPPEQWGWYFMGTFDGKSNEEALLGPFPDKALWTAKTCLYNALVDHFGWKVSGLRLKRFPKFISVENEQTKIDARNKRNNSSKPEPGPLPRRKLSPGGELIALSTFVKYFEIIKEKGWQFTKVSDHREWSVKSPEFQNVIIVEVPPTDERIELIKMAKLENTHVELTHSKQVYWVERSFFDDFIKFELIIELMLA